MNNLFKNKKFRYGSLGAGITVAVIALIVIVNIIFSALANSFRWYFDMTAERYYDLSDRTLECLDGIDPSQNDVTIYFFAPADLLTQAATSQSSAQSGSLWGMKYIYEMALKLAERYQFIKVDHIDLTTEPDRIAEITGDDQNSITFARYYVLIDNRTVERDADGKVILDDKGEAIPRHNYRVYSRNAFFTFEYTSGKYYATGFKGDFRLCSALMAVCAEITPTMYLITGHGEPVGAYTAGTQNTEYDEALVLCQIFNDSGYAIKKIDLQHEDFGDEKNAVAVIFAPKTDYSGNTEVENHNELGKIKSFIEKDDHSLMVIFGYGNGRLPGLERFVESECGVTVLPNNLKDNGENAIDVNMLRIVGEANTDVSSSGGKAAARIAGAGINNKVIFPNACPLTVTDSSKASAMYYIPSSSYLDTAEGRKNYSEKEGALASLTDLGHGSYVFCTGSSLTADVNYLDNPVYSNKDMYLSVIDGMTAGEIPFGIPYKVITSEGLDITKRESTVWMVVLCAAVPLAVLAAGTAVYIRRRHS